MLDKSVLFFVIAAILPACTTVTRGTKQKFPITSQPSGANVRISTTGENCTTPCNIKLRRKDSLTLTISKAGFVSQDHKLVSKVTGAGIGAMTAGNFLLGGIIGSAVDASNGSTRTLYPVKVDAELVPEVAAPAPVTAAAVATPVAAIAPDVAAAPAPAAGAPAAAALPAVLTPLPHSN